jgi:hypothetical protein
VNEADFQSFYASEKCFYVIKNIHTLCVIWGHIMLLLTGIS